MSILNPPSDIISRSLTTGANGLRIIIPSIVGPILAAILVLNRLYWRIRLVRTLGIDDLYIGLSLVRLRERERERERERRAASG
jgi:hypothetical protein